MSEVAIRVESQQPGLTEICLMALSGQTRNESPLRGMHPADGNHEMAEGAAAILEAHTRQMELGRVGADAPRVDAGVCRGCMEPIPEDRLAVIPDAKYCFDCLTLMEKRPVPTKNGVNPLGSKRR